MTVRAREYVKTRVYEDMDKRIKILTIGSAMYDIFLQYVCTDLLTIRSTPQPEQFILMQAGKKHELQDVMYHTGGGATNSAVSFARLGLEVSSFFKVGTDTAGKAITDELAHNNVRIDHVLTTNTVHTGTSFILPHPSGDNTTLMHRGANLTLTQAELPLAAIADNDYVYVTSLSGPTAPFIERITEYAKKHHTAVAVNPGTSQLIAGAHNLRNALPHIDILILNCYEASLLMQELITQALMPHSQTDKNVSPNTHAPCLLQMPLLPTEPSVDVRTFCKEILAHGPRIVVVTNGAEGVYVAVAQPDRLYFHPSLGPEVISTLGAGDAFGSCFVAQIAQNKPLEHAIRCGIANASSVIQHTGAKTGLLFADELEKRVQAINPDLLQTFDL